LKYLSLQHRVYLGTFVDDVDDWQHVAKVQSFCEDSFFCEINSIKSRIRSITGFLDGSPLTLKYYFNSMLKKWIANIIAQKKIDKIIVFSSAMVQYVNAITDIDVLIDFVDVDSLKWSEYASKHAFPMSLVYRRESAKLLAYERLAAVRSKQSFFVTDNETLVFKALAPECANKISTINNGVDAEYFSADTNFAWPFAELKSSGEDYILVFTGAMDYWPNIDSVIWFVSDVLPRVRQSQKNVFFYIVGRNPTAQVLALASEFVIVTGTVGDVRPYLQYASAVVAPLRVARGIQNKILEAMAMARPVVASSICVNSMDVDVGRDLLSAENAEEFSEQIIKLINSSNLSRSIGEAGRLKVQQKYSWTAHLSRINPYLGMSDS
jgi:sugar transferase (PEP-CTERM/EpsH1 system associated)